MPLNQSSSPGISAGGGGEGRGGELLVVRDVLGSPQTTSMSFLLGWDAFLRSIGQFNQKISHMSKSAHDKISVCLFYIAAYILSNAFYSTKVENSMIISNMNLYYNQGDYSRIFLL